MAEPVQEFLRAPALLGRLVPSTVGYRCSGQQPRIHRGLPSPYLTLIFSLDGPVVSGSSPQQAMAGDAYRHEVLLGGLHERPAFIAEPSAQAGVQLAIHPLASRAVFGAPAGEIDALVADGTEVLGASAPRLRERLIDLSSWPERFATVQDFLRRRIDAADRRPRPRAELAEAWVWMARHRGSGSIEGLATHVGLSRRQLGTLFAREIGLSPKQVSRLMRFEHAKRAVADAVAGDLTPDLTAVAVGAGFYDLAHLDRDFRTYTGLSPSGWISEERRNIQAGGHGTARE